VAGLKRSSEALARQAKDKDGELARALLEHAEAKKTLVATVQRLEGRLQQVTPIAGALPAHPYLGFYLSPFSPYLCSASRCRPYLGLYLSLSGPYL